MRFARPVVAVALVVGVASWAAYTFASAEIVLDETNSLGPSSDSSGTPSTATDGTNFLVVWVDARGGSAIYGTLVAPDGAVLVPTGFAVSTSAHLAAPAVSFDGANYVVVWQNVESGHIEGARVSPAGVVLDVQPVVISSSTGEAPALASTSSVSLVAWTHRLASGTLVVNFARVDAALAMLDQPDAPLAVGTTYATDVKVATDGTDFLASYASDDTMFAARITASGAILDQPAITLGTMDSESALVRLPGAYLVLWVSPYDTYAVRIQSDGTVLDAPAKLLRASLGGTLHAPSAAFNGSTLLVSWSREIGPQPWDYYARRFTASLVPNDPNEFLLGVGTRGVDDHGWLAATPAVFLQVWDSNGSMEYPLGTVFGVVLPASLASNTSTTTLLSLQGTAQKSPALAVNGDNAFVAWVEGGITTGDIRGQFFSAAGPASDAGVTICNFAGPQYTPSVASDGTGYVVTWGDLRGGYSNVGIFASRISASGVVLDPNGFNLVSTPGFRLSPSATANSAEYLVTWADDRTGTLNIWATRLRNTGAILDPGGFQLTTGADLHDRPNGAPGEHQFLVVFEVGIPRRIGYLRVSEGGAVLDAQRLIFDIGGNQYQPVVASDGTDFLVVWSDSKSDGGIDVSGARIDRDGGLVDPMPLLISTAPELQGPVRIAFDGERYVVTWLTPTHMSGVLVTRGGQVEGPEFFVTQTSGAFRHFGHAATPTIGRTLVAYEAYDARAGFATARVRARFIDTLDGGLFVDAGTFDAGALDDAGVAEVDAGLQVDAGAIADAGSAAVDAGTATDTGASADGGTDAKRVLKVGCGCGSTDVGAAMLVALLMLRARRSRHALSPLNRTVETRGD